MKTTSFFVLFICLLITVWSCTPNRGCIEPTADNYDLNAEEDDGTCIPSRDKLIGNYTYTNFWTNVVTGMDTFAYGNIEITEANTANNAFNSNFDGTLFLQGSVSANNLTFEYHQIQLQSYNGSGTWLTSDTIDMVLNITLTDPILPIPQPFTFYCKKTP